MSSRLSPIRGLLLFAFLAASCDAGGPTEPDPIEVPVQLTVSEAAGISSPIRLALVWRQGRGAEQRWISTFDTGLATVPTSTNVWFGLPPVSERSALTDVTSAYVTCFDDEYPVKFSAAVPRLVAYEDRDRSGDFKPDLPLIPGQDRVLAVNPGATASAYIAAFTNLDAVLAHLPLEYAECIRAYTSDRYSAFFMGNDYSDYAWAVATPLSANLDLSPTQYASVAMACDPSDVYSLVSHSPMVYQQRSTLVDVRLVSDVCTDAPWPCSRADISSDARLEPTPNVAYPGFSEFAFCVAVGNLDVLWSVTESIDCTGCDCEWRHSHQTWVVDATQPPATWPCGKQVEYCGVRSSSLWEFPDYCAPSLDRPD